MPLVSLAVDHSHFASFYSFYLRLLFEETTPPMVMPGVTSLTHGRSRVYRWGKDGIAGISDNHQHTAPSSA